MMGNKYAWGTPAYTTTVLDITIFPDKAFKNIMKANPNGKLIKVKEQIKHE